MTKSTGHRVLTINSGSSSLKAALYQMSDEETLMLSAELSRIGIPDSRMQITDALGATLFARRGDLPDHNAALQALFTWFEQHNSYQRHDAVGHRVVHGGHRYSEPQLITPELLAALRELVPIDPNHLPQALSAIQFVSRAYPALRQVACFDTAFHRQMPRSAQMYALPRHFYDEGIMRYGFHGLSYEYIAQELRILDGASASGRVIIAHLGNGASMAAMQGGKSIDTTMGFTPAEGLVMGSRSGDLDPGALIFLMEEKKMTPQAINALINEQSGLLGVSGISADMRDLLERESTHPHAAEATELFCYRAKKYLGAYVAALGGLDLLVFTGGIGEHAAVVRERICSGLEFLGIKLDSARNRTNASVISSHDSRVTVRVIKTDEELMIARHTVKLIDQGEENV
jgi:acetate kinase